MGTQSRLDMFIHVCNLLILLFVILGPSDSYSWHKSKALLGSTSDLQVYIYI